MKLEKLRNYRKYSRWVDGIFSKNPILIGGLALPFAVMITNNLKSSVSVSILLACSLIPTVLLASLVGKYLPEWGAMMVYTMFSMALVIASIPLILPISPEVVDSLGIYIPIIAINTIMLSLCSRYAKDTRKPVMALVDAVTYSIGFALVMCIVAFVRELFGNNTIWGVPASLPFKISGLQIAFAGFIIVAFLSALLRFIKRTALLVFYRHYNPSPEVRL
ncbi:Rnf-Nqr domain containing protein [Oscillospiraceae bacterium PP1C4]